MQSVNEKKRNNFWRVKGHIDINDGTNNASTIIKLNNICFANLLSTQSIDTIIYMTKVCIQKHLKDLGYFKSITLS